MTPTPFTLSFEGNKYRVPIYLTLISAGLVGNYLKYPIFLNIVFLFGSIFAMLALQVFGLGRGILAAAIISSYTYVLWNHPYAILIMTTEVGFVSRKEGSCCYL
jgi:two-component system cell cycle sensor histidine kinase/response regulator CckA